MKKVFKLILIIFSVILLIILYFIGIKYNINFLKKICIYILLIFIICLISIIFILIKFNLYKLLNKYRYHKCLKGNINIFTTLYIKLYENANYLQLHNILNKDIESVNLKFKKIEIIYLYKQFKICLILKKDSLKYNIIPSDIYIYKKHLKDININLNTDSFNLEIANKLDLIEKEIECFIKNTKVDKIFNGKSFKLVLSFIKRIKFDALIGIICSFILMLLFNILLIFSIKNNEIDNRIILAIVICSIFNIFFMVILGVCIYKIHLIKIINKDFNNKNISNVDIKPKKVKFIKNYYYITFYIVGIDLFYDTFKLKIYFDKNYSIKRKDYKDIKEKILNISTNISYLTNSKLAINGYDEYIKIIKKYDHLE